MPDAFMLRPAGEADVPAITRIYRFEVETGIATFEEIPPGEAEMAERMRKIQALDLPYLVAVSAAGSVLGYSYAGSFHARSAYRFTVEDTIYIDRAARGRGVGKALLTELVDLAERAGARQMMALITQVDDSASISLHEKLGFVPVGIARAVGYKFGRWTDVVYMQRALGPGDRTPPDRPAPALSTVAPPSGAPSSGG